LETDLLYYLHSFSEEEGGHMRRTLWALTITLTLLIFLCMPSIASADSGGVTWTLSGVTFGDGGTASGSFVYNATTNIVSSVNITTTTGLDFTGAVYDAVDPGFGPFPGEIVFVTSPSSSNYTGTPALDLLFASDLTNLGGMIATLLSEDTCGTAGCTMEGIVYRESTAGEVVGVPAPEPGLLLLLGTGLLGLATSRRKMFER
jgi:PEP-CTERM motif